jgi:DNA-binding SARP family transcriptional activator
MWLGRLAESRGQLQAALAAYAAIPGGSSHFAAAVERLSALANEHPDSGPVQTAYAELLLKSDNRDEIAAARDKWQDIARRSPPGSERRLRAEYSAALGHFKLGDKAAAAGVLQAALAAPSTTKGIPWEQRIKALLQQCSR